MTEKREAPLRGVRILDLSRVIAGPLCTMQLADMGAEVIKIENPAGGDDSRRLKPPEAGGESHSYLAYNRNKKSVALDIRKPEGQSIINEIAERSDVLVENFRVGVLKRFGLDYETMKTRHPHLIYVSISAYGQKGPMSDRPGYDPILQAETGMMTINGDPSGPPMRHQLSIIDMFTAFNTATAICAALYERRSSGRGQRIDMALMASAVAGLGNAGAHYLASGENPPRPGNEHPTAAGSTLFETRTGPIFIVLTYERFFVEFFRDIVTRPDIPEDPRFKERTARYENRAELHALLADIFAGDTCENWLKRLRDFPAGKVRTIKDALESEEVAARGMVRTVPHPTAGSVRLIGSPYCFSDTPIVEPIAPPLLGADTENVLTNLLGYDQPEIDKFRNKGIIP